jgi:RNA polymerase sigma-70 factor (ECF subfamily)
MASGWDSETGVRAALLAAARGGDAEAFAALVMPHRRALHLHCYRLLGSLTLAGDALGEALLRARRGLRGYRPDDSLHTWLLRTTTVTCLRADTRRGRLTTAEAARVQPYPDRLLGQLTVGQDPAADVGGRNTIALPFIAALQTLPAPQRAVLVLHEVLDRPLENVARLLGLSVEATGRSLARAQETLAEAADGMAAPPATQPIRAPDQAAAAALVQAWRAGDVPAVTALLSEDVTVTLPEGEPRHGRAAVEAFLHSTPAGRRLDLLPVVETAANGRPALAVYEPVDDVPRSWALVVLALTGGRIAGLDVFTAPDLLSAFGLPPLLPPGRPESPRPGRRPDCQAPSWRF